MPAEAARDSDADVRAATISAPGSARVKAIERRGFRRLCMHKIHGYSRFAVIDPTGSAKAWAGYRRTWRFRSAAR